MNADFKNHPYRPILTSVRECAKTAPPMIFQLFSEGRVV